MTKSILVVDDDSAMRRVVAKVLSKAGYDVREAADGLAALEALADGTFELVLTDVCMPGMSGSELASRIVGLPEPPLVMLMTAQGDLEAGIAAVRNGACDYLIKPLDLEGLSDKIASVLGEVPASQAEALADDSLMGIVGASAVIAKLRDQIKNLREAPCNVFVVGETGTGKELVARALHDGGPFIAVNCAALPQHVAERELFGHEKGAFTGADTGGKGYFEAAQGGTLFLDEVTEIDPGLQAKLLRAIEERQIVRLGNPTPVPVDVRIVAATNRSPREAVAAKLLREDLYFRLATVELQVPPLRERRDDVDELVDYFCRFFAERYERGPCAFDDAALHVLRRYPWPGNVRELRNVVERAVALSRDAQLKTRDLPRHVLLAVSDQHNDDEDLLAMPYAEAKRRVMERFAARYLTHQLDRAEGNVSRAAELADLPRTSLHRMLRQYGIGDLAENDQA